MTAKTPKIASSPSSGKIVKASVGINYKTMHPVWQLGIMDINGKWGYRSCAEIAEFKCSSTLADYIADNNLEDEADAIAELNGRYRDESDFFGKFSQGNIRQCPVELLPRISSDIHHNYFIEKIYPKLREFESITWDELEKQTYDNKSKHHPISKGKLCKEAQQRLEELGQGDVDEVFSLRLEGKLRLFGIRELNCLKILWIDQNHEVCPSHKKHT